MAGITSLKIGVKTADERQNAAVRLRPGQSAEDAPRRAAPPAAEAPAPATRKHPDIIENEPEHIGKPNRVDKFKDDSIAYLRRQTSYLRTRADKLQGQLNAATQKLHALEAKRDSQKKERGEMYRTSIKVAAGLRREIATEQRLRKKAEAEVSKLTRTINASRDENTELRSIIAKLEQAILLGPGHDSQE
jgi:hypothetical protein